MPEPGAPHPVAAANGRTMMSLVSRPRSSWRKSLVAVMHGEQQAGPESHLGDMKQIRAVGGIDALEHQLGGNVTSEESRW